MANAAIAFAKAHFRRRMMACSTSIGPGATNLLTSAALAHVNRLPVLFLPGDIFVSRDPDPVLQQVESSGDGTVSANDCFRPVSRYFDRIVHPSQLLTSLPRAVLTLTDPALCGPVTLALPQDVQADAFDYPVDFFDTPVVEFRATPPSESELAGAVRAVMAAKRPVMIAGGGVLYGGRLRGLARICRAPRRAGLRDPGWQELAAMGPSSAAGLGGCDRLARSQRAGQRGGLDPRRGHPPCRTSPPDRTHSSPRPGWSPSTQILLTRARRAASRCRPTRVWGLEALSKALPHWQAEAAWTERAKNRSRRMALHGG